MTEKIIHTVLIVVSNMNRSSRKNSENDWMKLTRKKEFRAKGRCESANV